MQPNFFIKTTFAKINACKKSSKDMAKIYVHEN